ncbi:MAG: hypothetical protein QM831_24680 [Kofleriaceae bacterium]
MRWLFVLVAGCRFGFDARVADAPPIDLPAPDPGCADGTREAFTDMAMYPAIAGCRAAWTGKADLRATSTGAACGNDVTCAQPADACAAGWHLCGLAGDPGEISSRVSASQCLGEAGLWVAAMGHCNNYNNSICNYQSYGCYATDIDCSEPVCCGEGCSTGNQCKDGVWSEGTRAAATLETQSGVACGAFTSGLADGVLCCKPADVDPIGCADGTREAFVDQNAYPRVAGCQASWSGALDLRATSTGARCGNSLGPCAVPADVCSPGWHLCGATGDPSEITSRIASDPCLTTPGRWVTAMSHCAAETTGSVCDYSQFPCTADAIDCAESACCGTDCSQGNDCKDGLYTGVTRVALNGTCGAFSSANTDGLLCCR